MLIALSQTIPIYLIAAELLQSEGVENVSYFIGKLIGHISVAVLVIFKASKLIKSVIDQKKQHICSLSLTYTPTFCTAPVNIAFFIKENELAFPVLTSIGLVLDDLKLTDAVTLYRHFFNPERVMFHDLDTFSEIDHVPDRIELFTRRF